MLDDAVGVCLRCEKTFHFGQASVELSAVGVTEGAVGGRFRESLTIVQASFSPRVIAELRVHVLARF